MDALIGDVLRLARHGQTIEERAPISLDTVVDRAWSMAVDSDAADLVRADGLGTIQAAESRLQQLFENLFGNAIEHGGPAVTVRVGRRDDEAGVYVADDGPGIAHDEQAQVFDPGYSTAVEGTGLGLAIVERIVEAHGWEITVADSAAGGTRFDVRWGS